MAGTLWAWVLTLEKVSWTQLAARAGADSLMVRTPSSCRAYGRAAPQSSSCRGFQLGLVILSARRDMDWFANDG